MLVYNDLSTTDLTINKLILKAFHFARRRREMKENSTRVIQYLILIEAAASLYICLQKKTKNYYSLIRVNKYISA
jgi:hypothetical protein